MQKLEPTEAARLADILIATEIGRQDQMWGDAINRPDTINGQMFLAAMAQGDALFDRMNGVEDAFDEPPMIYPEDWSGFRDYGSFIANLVVMVAFLRQEIKRRLSLGEDYTRLSRGPDQVYRPETGLPKTIEA